MNTPIRKLDAVATAKLRASIKDLYERMTRIPDYRTREGDYPLPYLLTSVVIGLLMGNNYVAHIESFILRNPYNMEYWLGKNYHGAPSDTNLLRALWYTDPTDLLIIVSEWGMQWLDTDELGYAIDGKAVRAALEKILSKSHSPYILNAFVSDGSRLEAQIKIDSKKSELSVVGELFDCLPMCGALITTDAFATYSHVLKMALEKGAHCLFPIKDNQPKLCEKATAYFLNCVETKPGIIEWYEDEDNGKNNHGRLEYRKTGVITVGVVELVRGTKFEGLVAGIALVTRKRSVVRKKGGNVDSTQELLYLFTKPGMTAKEVATAARGHWKGCEIVHYILDTEFDEDLSTIRKEHGMENMSCLRKLVYGIICWIQRESMKNNKLNLGSFHKVRMLLRDLKGIPAQSDADFRKQVKERLKARNQKKLDVGKNKCKQVVYQ